MVETVAAYLGIIDIAVRLTRHYGARRARRGLLVALDAVSKNETLSIDQARGLVQHVLQQQLGVTRSSKITDTLFVIESLMPTLEPGVLGPSSSRIQPYAAILTEIINKAGALLEDFHAFDAWSADRSTYTRDLEFAYTKTAFIRSSLYKVIRNNLRVLRGTHFKVVLTAHPVYQDKCRIDGLNVYLYDKDGMFSTIKVEFRGDYEWWIGVEGGLITFELFKLLMFSILTDVISFYVRGQAEIEDSNALLDLIFRVRGAAKHPF